MAAVGVLIYFLGSRSARGQAAAISRPLGELTEAAATIARGDYTTEITTRTNDEVGVLATSFETMRKTVKEYTEKLEVKVAERTRELKEAMRELKRSNTELEQFAYVASHDLQEPLRMVSSYMGLLERRYKDKLDDSAREFIGFAVDGAQRMRQLITDLLTYSRVGTKGKPFEETDCGDVYEKATKNLEVAIKEHGARVTHDELPTIAADGSQLVQLFQNLIGNALKFCRDRTPEVHVSARREDGRWVFGVKDNGIGIAPENRERVFQIFQRLHTREEFEGTGIGLSVCKKIVERHGGDIRVESEEGVGTTFWFALPADPDAVTAPDPSPETAEQLVEQS
jgi:light-regulated signal transduction histidine kinase (bacteriophytochrome)